MFRKTRVYFFSMASASSVFACIFTPFKWFILLVIVAFSLNNILCHNFLIFQPQALSFDGTFGHCSVISQSPRIIFYPIIAVASLWLTGAPFTIGASGETWLIPFSVQLFVSLPSFISFAVFSMYLQLIQSQMLCQFSTSLLKMSDVSGILLVSSFTEVPPRAIKPTQNHTGCSFYQVYSYHLGIFLCTIPGIPLLRLLCRIISTLYQNFFFLGLFLLFSGVHFPKVVKKSEHRRYIFWDVHVWECFLLAGMVWLYRSLQHFPFEFWKPSLKFLSIHATTEKPEVIMIFFCTLWLFFSFLWKLLWLSFCPSV